MSSDNWLTPYTKRSEFPEELGYLDKARVLFEQVDGWYLSQAVELVEMKVEASFSALALSVPCIELLGDLLSTEGMNSTEKFRIGFEYVFPEVELGPEQIGALWGLRNGLAHSLVPRGKFLFYHLYEEAVKVGSTGYIEISPKLFVYQIRKAFFRNYTELVSGHDTVRIGRFEKVFDRDRRIS